MATSNDSTGYVGGYSTTAASNVPPDSGNTGKRFQGAAEIRQLKKVLKDTFPSITAAVTATHTELNLLDGVTASTAEINTLASSGISNADLVKLAALTASAAELNTLAASGISNADLVKLAAITAAAVEINTLTSSGISNADLVKLAAITAAAAELNQLDGVTVGGTSAGDIATINGTQTLTNKTLTAPTINSPTITGDILLTGGEVLGYGTGSGGTVTQLTSKDTAVTLNKPTGRITMHNQSLNANEQGEFQFNNSELGANDTIIVVPTWGFGTSYEVRVSVGSGGGACFIQVRNVTTSTRAEALELNFTIIKGAVS